MKVILINGLISSGKNTIAKYLSETLDHKGFKTTYCDIDSEVTRLNPKNNWTSKEDESSTWLQARKKISVKC